MSAVDSRAAFERQHAATRGGDSVPAKVRIDRIDRCIALLCENETALCQAVAVDFGQRPHAVTRALDILPSVLALKHARARLRRWMLPARRRPGLPLLLPGTRARIEYQPLGVVGIVSPWNIPIGLTFGPLASALAAGNRCLVKPSELTPLTSSLLQRLVAERFHPTELAVVTGEVEAAEAFTALPFDHLLFTGSTAVGRRVMAAAARNLTPVTLELGGKCPAVIGRSARLDAAIERLLTGKLVNAGQVCLAPDHVYLPRRSLDAFVDGARTWAARAYPGLPNNPDYTSIVNEAHRARLQALLDDAIAKGARVVPLGVEPESDPARRLFAPALVLDAREDMRILEEEIFGPLLPVLTYERIDEVLARLDGKPRPLALYHFGRDSAERAQVLERTRSGGVTFDDIAMHYLSNELPFGGLGESGLGAYHGEHGFARLSHARAVLEQSRMSFGRLTGLVPPYGRRLETILKALIRR